MASHIARRKFLATLLGGAAAWPLAARAQQREQMRRIGALMNLTADDPEASARVTALAQGLQQLGWTVGRNLQIDYRWGAGDADTNTPTRGNRPDCCARAASGHAAAAPPSSAMSSRRLTFALIRSPRRRWRAACRVR